MQVTINFSGDVPITIHNSVKILIGAKELRYYIINRRVIESYHGGYKHAIRL
jgi:hypothetical protein